MRELGGRMIEDVAAMAALVGRPLVLRGSSLGGYLAITGQLEAGTVWLNEVHQYSPFQAFGGHKQSGIGCENSLHGMLEYTNRQTITLNRTV